MERERGLALGIALALAVGCASSTPPPAETGPLKHYQMARMYFDQGRTDDALREIDLSLRQDRSLPQVHFYQGFIYYSVGDLAKAEPCFQSAIGLDPYYTDARMYLAATLDGLGRPNEALAELERALANRTYPTPEKILVNKALILDRQGESDAALAALRQAVEVRPRYYRAHLEMGRLLEKAGRSGEALAAYQAAAPGYEQEAAFHYEYGRTLFRNRREAEAKRELRRAIDLAPGSPTAAKAQELLAVIG